MAFVSQSTNLVAGDTDTREDVYVKDLQTGAITLASVSSSGAKANSYSYQPSISGDGRYVTFYSLATNLIWGTRTVSTIFSSETWSTTRRRW